MRINKSEFVSQFARTNDIGVELAEHLVNNFIWLIYNSVARGDEVNLSGFGAFSASRREPRVGVHPRTGEKIQIGAYDTPKFKAGSYFKALLRGEVQSPQRDL